MISSLAGIRGQETIEAGHYVLNNHGQFIPVSKAAYEHGLVLEQRLSTLVPAIFFAFAALVHSRPPAVGDGLPTALVP